MTYNNIQNTLSMLLTHLMERSIHRTDETLELIRKYYSGPVEFPEDLDSFQP